MKYTQTVEITPEEALQLAGNPIYSWLSAVNQPNHNELARNESQEGDCIGDNKKPVSGLSVPYSDMYKYTVFSPYQDMQTFFDAFGTMSGASREEK